MAQRFLAYVPLSSLPTVLLTGVLRVPCLLFRATRNPEPCFADVLAAVRNLSPREQEQLKEWLENLLEDRLELKEEFKAEIAAGKEDIAEGRVRIRKP